MSLLRQVAKAVFASADLLLPSPGGPRVLIYHRVGTSTGQQMEVLLEDFRWQLDWLDANREIVDLESAIRRWNDPDADHLVVLTFDDGYEDTFTTVYPLLKERGFPFTLYIAPGMLEEGFKADAGTLTWQQVREMQDSGLLTVGAHTHTHRDLRTTDPAETLLELEMSDHLIQTKTGSAPRHFAYPWGYWSKAADPLIRSRYESAVLGAHWRAEVESDRHRIHRFPVQLSDGRSWFRSRLKGGLLIEERVRRRIRSYSGP